MTFPQNLIVHIEKSSLNHYEDLQKKKISPFFEQKKWSIFLTAMLIGHQNNARIAIKQQHDLFQAAFLKDNEEWLVKSFAIAQTNSLLCLADDKEILKIAEEYANGGIIILNDNVFGPGVGDPMKKLDIIAKNEISQYNQLILKENSQPNLILYAWKDIILKGENDTTEFKSSLRWDYKLNQVTKDLEYVIAKGISAFLNSRGGKLFIGIDDEGNTLGLQNDYETLGKKQNKDGFSLKLQDLINNYLGKEFHQFITIQFEIVDEKEICIITITPSDKPVYVRKNNTEEFFIRASASSQPMSIKQSHDYIELHWKKN
jgi:dnd system-associated protein 4